MSGPAVKQFIQTYFSVKALAYTDIAGLALFAYDSLLTLDNEVHLIWKRKLSFISVAYFLARYSTVILLLFPVMIDILDLVGLSDEYVTFHSLQRQMRVIAGADLSLEEAVSAILVCRFILQLREFNGRTQTVPSFHIQTKPGIRGHLSRLSEHIIEELGNQGMHDGWDSNENDQASVRDGNITELRITAEEFPWAVDGDSRAPVTVTATQASQV
ncbi:hypothetical protein M422DRAFT_251192 [Sphaerobolus stellatus SS14]|uniref:DUF6533 domain-containing protein n=1 Tax=Sphaerobolus stellatus (strain SS14) TaxID=990650 RepID=A0A0C9W311_SPHS4|nr:hypothetical protein M422DRAFT_251192 [Sphaerobolus stellatus SS14]